MDPEQRAQWDRAQWGLTPDAIAAAERNSILFAENTYGPVGDDDE